MKNYSVINFCWNYACTFEMYWTNIFHKKITSLMYRFWEILININLFSVNLESVITRHYKIVYQVWFRLLSELKILTSFKYNRLFRICDTIFTAPRSFSDEKYDVKKHLLWKIANIVAFSSTRQNIVPLKACTVIRNIIWQWRSKKMSSSLP